MDYKKHLSNNTDILLYHLKSKLKPKIVKPSELVIELKDEEVSILESDAGWIREDEFKILKEELSEMNLTDIKEISIEYKIKDGIQTAKYSFK